MRYLHTMVRVADLDRALDFYVSKLGLAEARRVDNPAGRFTLVFLCAPERRGMRAKQGALADGGADLQLRPEDYQGGRNFGHLAYEVDDIYATCQRLMDGGVTINRPPRDGHMAFVRSPDGISIELLQKGGSLPKAEPWSSMPNVGAW